MHKIQESTNVEKHCFSLGFSTIFTCMKVQNSSKILSKVAQNALRDAQDAKRTLQDVPRGAQDAPRRSK